MAAQTLIGSIRTARTALGVQRDLVKSLSTLFQSLHRHLATCWNNEIHGHAQLFIQHLHVYWLIISV